MRAIEERPINIKNLLLEDPQPKVHTEWQEASEKIHESDLDEIIKSIDSTQVLGTKDPLLDVQYLRKFSLLFGNDLIRDKKFGIPKSSVHFLDVLPVASSLAHLDPNFKVDEWFNSSDLNDQRASFYNDFLNGQITTFLEKTSAFKTLYPSKHITFIGKSLIDYLNLEKRVQHEQYMSDLANLRIINEKLFRSLIDDESIARFANFTDQLLDKQAWAVFLRSAYVLKMVTAEKINFQNQTIELVMPEKELQEEYNTPPLPEAKRF